MRNAIQAAALAVATIIVVGCQGSDGSAPPTSTTATASAARLPRPATLPRPAALSGLPPVELVGPGELNAGRAPTFEWSAVPGAAAYQLTVLGPDAPRWAWRGTDTSVRYGGVAEGVNGPSLVAGSWWGVGALDDDGSVVALSDLQLVSPGDDRGPAPSWASVSTADGADASPPTATEAAAGPAGARACDLLAVDEIQAAIGGTWNQPMLDVFPSGQSSDCTWTSENGTRFSVSILPASSYDPDGWGADGPVDRLGEKAFRVSHGLDRRIGFVHGEFSVMLRIDYRRIDEARFADLARSAEARLP